MAFNIADLFEHTADAVPERLAVVTTARRVTYAELEKRANRLAHHLAAHGVTRGSHVGVYAYNRVEFVETMLAAFKLRAVPINVNFRYREAELAYIFDNADLVALVHERRFAPLVSAVLPGSPKLAHVIVVDDESDEPLAEGSVSYEDALAAGSPARDFEPRSPDDLYVLYTGGTTGHPKGVMWRHEDVFRTLGGGIDVRTGERVPTDTTLAERAAASEKGMVSFPTAPLMHGTAQWGTLGALFAGNTVVLIPRFDAHGVWELVQREGVNAMLITGDAMARPLVEALQEHTYDTSSLVAISSTAAVFSPTVKDQLLGLLPNVFVTEAIGASETGFSGMTMVQKGQEQKGGPRVQPGPDTIVIGEDGRPVAPGSGAIGRVARSGNVPLGYYKDPEKTAQTFVEIAGVRYSIPGDFALVEADGTITLLGRGSVCINSGGEKIFPEEVEGVLKSHPAVFDCLVVGIPDERWGQAVAAVVQPRPGRAPTLDDLAAHVREHLAGYKAPRALFLVPEIERHPSGKPNYPWAQEYAAKAHGRAQAPA